MDAELRRRDQNLEEALKQGDEECKSKLETREKELSEELRAREDAFLSDQLRRDSELLKIMKEREDVMEQNMLQKADAFGYLYKTLEGNKAPHRTKGQRNGSNPKL